MSTPKMILPMSAALSLLLSLHPLSVAAAKAVPQLESMQGMPPYIVKCNGMPMHVYNVPASPCAAIAPRGKSAPVVDSGPGAATIILDQSLIGRWSLTVRNGIWTTPGGQASGTFSDRSWPVDMQFGQVYPADPVQGWPESTVYFGQAMNECGSASAAILVIETPTPDIGAFSVRLDDCGIPPVNGVQQVYVEAAVRTLYTRDRVTMGGVITSTQFDNRALDGNPKRLVDYGGLATFGRSLVQTPQ